MEKKSPFEGYDYLELAEYWGIDMSKGEEDIVREMIQMIEDALDQAKDESDFFKKVTEDLRAFVQALWAGSKKHNFSDAPDWEGLLKVEDHETFLQYCVPLLPYMWN